MSSNIRSLCRAVFAAAIVALCAACETIPNEVGVQALPKVYAGRFSVSFLKDGQPQREQGGFDWTVQQTQDTGNANTADKIADMQLAINSPIGITLATIAYEANQAQEERASLKTPLQRLVAPTLDELMQRALGWRLPLVALLPWLSATEPGQTSSEWQVTVVSRHDNGSPKVLTAQHEALKITARLVFEAFEVLERAPTTTAPPAVKP